MVMTFCEFVGSRLTLLMVWITVSFCMSMPKIQSMPNSKNSQMTPMVIEKQNATMMTKSGERRKVKRSLSLRMSTIEKPMAAARKPLTVWRAVSQNG
ncbi:MAG: hypothetical protein BWY50_02186 [Spirochaetes bacterium ADurb.Bin315]|nr:MAG: hypothetical protein BWY50_02186 [Spirochaetes bacterium ADurb.Bin315]